MMRVNTKLRRFALLNFNWTLFAFKFVVTSAVSLCLGTTKGWLLIFLPLSVVLDGLLLKYPPAFDFELTEEEAKKVGFSTDDRKKFLITSPKVRLLRIGVIALLALGFKLLNPDLIHSIRFVFFTAYSMGFFIVDFFIRKALGIPVTASMKYRRGSVRFAQMSDDTTAMGIRRFNDECTAAPGSTAWCLNKTREMNESSSSSMDRFNSMASQMSIHRPFP